MTDDARDTTTVRAAGCVLWRRSPVGTAAGDRPRPPAQVRRLVAPQGQAEARRGRARAARCARWRRRPGWAARPARRCPPPRYVANGRPKEVRYWAAEAVAGDFTPNDEVDRLLWLPPPAARDRLTQRGTAPSWTPCCRSCTWPDGSSARLTADG